MYVTLLHTGRVNATWCSPAVWHALYEGRNPDPWTHGFFLHKREKHLYVRVLGFEMTVLWPLHRPL